MLSNTSASLAPLTCPHCGLMHDTTCPRIRAIEYHPNGTTKRIEFHERRPDQATPQQWHGDLGAPLHPARKP